MESENLIESLIELVNDFDFAKIMPELDSVMGWIDLFVRICVLAAPVALLFFGLWWLVLPPKEANHHFGYRCYFGMGSVNAWRYTQRLAGILFTGVGLILTLVMFGVTAGFQKLDVMDMLWKAVKCGIWEAAIIALVNIVLQVTVAFYFDGKGHLRRRKKHEPKAKPAETEI